MIVGLHGFAHVDEVAGGEEGFVACEHGLIEWRVFGELRLDEGVEHLQIFLGHRLACGEFDEAAQQALGLLLRLLRFHLHAKIIKQYTMRRRRPGLRLNRSLDFKPLHGDARLTSFREGWIAVGGAGAVGVHGQRHRKAEQAVLNGLAFAQAHRRFIDTLRGLDVDDATRIMHLVDDVRTRWFARAESHG